jgi:hypothetical protein
VLSVDGCDAREPSEQYESVACGDGRADVAKVRVTCSTLTERKSPSGRAGGRRRLCTAGGAERCRERRPIRFS